MKPGRTSVLDDFCTKGKLLLRIGIRNRLVLYRKKKQTLPKWINTKDLNTLPSNHESPLILTFWKNAIVATEVPTVTPFHHTTRSVLYYVYGTVRLHLVPGGSVITITIVFRDRFIVTYDGTYLEIICRAWWQWSNILGRSEWTHTQKKDAKLERDPSRVYIFRHGNYRQEMIYRENVIYDRISRHHL